VRFAVPLGLTDIVMKLNSMLDRFLIAAAFVAALVAEYSFGAWQIPLVTTVAFSVGHVITPDLRRHFEEGHPDAAITLWRAAIAKVSLIVIPITLVFIVAAEEIIGLLFTTAYPAAADVFRIYCVLTIGRVAAFGNVLVAAGQPRVLLTAAILSLVFNVAFSIPLLVWVGFLGPPIGTVLGFVCTIVFYCWGIGKAAGLPLRKVFPLARYGRILVTASVGAGALWLCKAQLPSVAALRIAIVAVGILAAFAVLGTLTRLIQREDWRFLTQWARRRKPGIA
jgi:O-antigen/teichoic acid export membrane protein